MKRTIVLIFLYICFTLTSHAQYVPEISVNLNQVYQTIVGIGASDAWCTEPLGVAGSENAKEKAAQWLFATTTNRMGDPEGIGLSNWRFIIDPLAPLIEGVGVENGNYNWENNPSPGRTYFLGKALEYGCTQIGAWSGSIPQILMPGGYSDASLAPYAKHLANVITHYKEQGLNFSYISPVNEPQYDWNDGVVWRTEIISKMVKAVNKEFAERNIDTKIMLGEAGAWTELYGGNDWASNQIQSYFDPQSPNYIGDLNSVMHTFSSHSYWTEKTNGNIINTRTAAKAKADQYNIKLRQTEWSLLQSTPMDGFPASYGEASDMDLAMMLAKVLHSDLRYTEVDSWDYWEAFGSGGDARYHLIHTIQTGGAGLMTVESRKNLWALGQFSFFIRPGYKRIGLTGIDDLAKTMGTAYVSPDQSKVVVVVVNMEYKSKKYALKFGDLGNLEVAGQKMMQTTNMLDMKNARITSTYLPDFILEFQPRSVSTLVYDLKEKGTAIRDVNAGESLEVYPNPVTNNQLKIGKGKVEADVELFSLSGVKMYKAHTTAGNVTLPALSKGIYTIKVATKETVSTQKLIIN